MLSWESYKWGLEADEGHEIPPYDEKKAKEIIAEEKRKIKEAKTKKEVIQLLEGHIKALEEALTPGDSEHVILHHHYVRREDVKSILEEAKGELKKAADNLHTLGETKGFIKKTLDYIGDHKVATGVGGAVGLAAVGGGAYYLHRRREAARREREEAAREWFYR